MRVSICSLVLCRLWKNLIIERNVFFSSGCKAQDQSGITIGDGTLVGRNVVTAAPDHLLDPASRRDRLPFRHPARGMIRGSAVTMAGMLASKDVPVNMVAGGIPAKALSRIEGTKPDFRIQKLMT